MIRFGPTTLAALAALALAAPAAAVPYKFVVVDPTLTQNGAPFDGNGYTFFFDSTPQVDSATADSFTLAGSAYYGAGVYGSYRADGDFTFYTDGLGLDTPLNVYFSEQLFTGDTSNPTFRTGRFDLDVGSITISAVGVPAAVPEPAGWAMMIGGIGITGGVARRRRHSIRTTVTYG